MTTKAAATTKLADLMLSMTEKQRAYVEARARGMPPTQSLRAAGYAESASTWILENHPKIREAMREMQRHTINRINVTRVDVLEGLLDAVQTAATSTELREAWREIGRLIGAYEPDKVEVTTRNLTAEKLLSLSDNELARLVAHKDKLTIESETVDAEYEVLREALEPPQPIALEAPDDDAD